MEKYTTTFGQPSNVMEKAESYEQSEVMTEAVEVLTELQEKFHGTTVVGNEIDQVEKLALSIENLKVVMSDEEREQFSRIVHANLNHSVATAA